MSTFAIPRSKRTLAASIVPTLRRVWRILMGEQI